MLEFSVNYALSSLGTNFTHGASTNIFTKTNDNVLIKKKSQKSRYEYSECKRFSFLIKVNINGGSNFFD